MTSRIKCKSCGAESIAGGDLFCWACVAEIVEFLHEVAKPAYNDSDPASLLKTLQSRAQALLQKSPCGLTPHVADFALPRCPHGRLYDELCKPCGRVEGFRLTTACTTDPAVCINCGLEAVHKCCRTCAIGAGWYPPSA